MSKLRKNYAKDARALFEKAEGVTVYDDTEKLVYPTPRMASGKDDISLVVLRVSIHLQLILVCFR